MRYRSRQQLVSDIVTEYGALRDLLSSIPEERYREAGVWGDDWSIHDLVAHLAEWQAMFLTWYREGLAGRKPDMPAPGYKWNETPRLNRDIRERHRDRDYTEVASELDRSHSKILAMLDGLDDDAILKPGRFEWTGRYPLTTYLGANTASHYRFATKVLKRWIRKPQ